MPIARFLGGELAGHIADRKPDDLVFAGIRKRPGLRVSTFRYGVQPSRHTAASLAIASGADVKVVRQMLGHASPTMNLDTYGHLGMQKRSVPAFPLVRTAFIVVPPTGFEPALPP